MAPVYAGIGSRQTPPDTLQDMTLMAGWLAATGWRLASGGAHGADSAFARGAPVDQRTLWLPWRDYNRLSGADCVIPDPSDMEACIALAARLHPAWHKCNQQARLLHGRNAAILLGPRLDTPVNAVVAWTPGGAVQGGTGMGLRIAAEHDIEVLNLATIHPRAACERLRDIARALAAEPTIAAPPTRSTLPVREPIASPRITAHVAEPDPDAPDPARVSHQAPPLGRAPDPDAARSDEQRTELRDAWDPQDAVAAIHTAYAALRDMCPDETPLGSERQALAYGFVQALHSRAQSLSGAADATYLALQDTRDERLPSDAPNIRSKTHIDDLDSHEIQNAVAAHRHAADRASAFEELTAIAAECYRADFNEPWRAPRNSSDFSNLRSQGLSRIQRAHEAADARPRLASWLERWRILRQEAINRKIPQSDMPAYATLVAEARDIHAGPGLPEGDAKWLEAFVEQHPLNGPAPDRGTPSAEHGRSPATAEWDRDRALAAVRNIAEVFEHRILPDGTQIADDREQVFSALTTWLHRECNRVADRMAYLTRHGDPAPGSLRTSLDALDAMRTEMAAAYHRHSRRQWVPPPEYDNGRTHTMTHSSLAAEAAARISRHHKASAKIVAGTYIAVSGSRDWTDTAAVYRALDAMKAQHPDMVLIHGGAQTGAAPIARKWASTRGVDQVLYKPQWHKHGRKAAPIRRNQTMLDQNPAAVVSFTAPGEPEHIVIEARARGIPVTLVQDPSLAATAPQEPDHMTRSAASAPLDISPLPADPAPAHTPADEPSAAAPETPPAAPRQHDAAIDRRTPATTDLSPAPVDNTRLADELDAHMHAQPVVTHPIVDGRLLHYTETAEYSEWATRARTLVDQVPDISHPDAANYARPALELLHELRDELDDTLDTNAARPLVEDLYDEVQERLDQIHLQTMQTGISWIDDNNTPDLMRFVAALADRLDAASPGDRPVQDALLAIRRKHDVAVENREHLDRVDTRLREHLEAREVIHRHASERRIPIDEHPEYEKWEKRVDALSDQVADIFGDPDTYRGHLTARPALAASIECTARVLVSTRDTDLHLAAPQAPAPSPGPARRPEIAPAHEIAPAPDTAPVRRPEPEPEPSPGISFGM